MTFLAVPRLGVCGGTKIFGSALLQPARRVCVSLSAFSIVVVAGELERNSMTAFTMRFYSFQSD